MPFWSGRVGNCLWSYAHDKASTSDWESYLAAHRRALTTAPRPTTMLTVVYQASPPNAGERKMLADMVRGSADAILAHAMVADTAIARGVLTALDWLVKKPFKESVFSDVREGVRWLTTFTPELRVTEIVLAIAAAVPHDALMPDLRNPPR